MFLEQKYAEQGLNRRTALELVRCSSLFRCSRPWNNILEQELEQLPVHEPWDHAIELSLNVPESLRTKIYPMSPVEQEELDKFIEENTRKGYIRPSKLPMASPVFFVKKKDRKL